MWRRLGERINVTGLDRVYDESCSVARKVIWSVLLLVANVFLGYHLFERVSYFFSYPVSTDFRITYNNSLPFPAVTICDDRNNYQELTENPRFLAHWSKDERYTEEKVMANFEAIFAKTLNEYVTHCQWQSTQCTRDMWTISPTDYGICFSFNRNGSLKATFPSMAGGLTLKATGHLNALIYHSYDIPLFLEKHILLPPGYVQIALAYSEVHMIRGGGCRHEPAKYYEHFTGATCFLSQLADAVIAEHGCVIPVLLEAKVGNFTACTPSKWMKIIKTVMKGIRRTAEFSGPNCNRPCESLTFDFTMSGRPTTGHSSSIKGMEVHALVNDHNVFSGQKDGTKGKTENKTLDTASPKTLDGASGDQYHMTTHLAVFHRRMQYRLVKQNWSYKTLALFADLGGALGLALGACLFTVVEVIEAVVLALSHCYTKKHVVSVSTENKPRTVAGIDAEGQNRDRRNVGSTRRHGQQNGREHNYGYVYDRK